MPGRFTGARPNFEKGEWDKKQRRDLAGLFGKVWAALGGLQGTPSVPSEITSGDVSDAGTSQVPAPSDHVHAFDAGANVSTVEVDLGTPKTQGKFTISDADIAALSTVHAWQAPGPYTGKGTLADEAQMAPVEVIAVAPSSGSAVVYWRAVGYVIARPQAYDQTRGGARQIAVPAVQQAVDNIDSRLQAVAIGRVGGNVKFSYAIY